MSTTFSELRGNRVAARNGVIGLLQDVYFGQQRWAVRFLVVHIGGPGRRLLVPPSAVEPGLSSKRKLRLALTLEQLETVQVEQTDERSICSCAEAVGYGIEARDGAIGEVQDFVIDDDPWRIVDVVVDTLKWWPGGLVRVHPQYVERIERDSRRVRLRLTRGQVKLSGARSPRR